MNDGEETGAPTAKRGGAARWPLHPLLFAAAPVLAMYVSNLRETDFSGVAPTLATAVACAAILLAAMALLARRLGPRAAILASIVIVVALNPYDLYGRLDRLVGGALPNDKAVPIMLVIAATLLFITAIVRLDLTLPNAVLNGIALVLVATPLAKAVSYEWEVRRLPAPPAATPLLDTEAARPATDAAGPDIVFIVFDRYGSEATLRRIYGIDNSAFLERLRARGFYVASESHSNYPKTAPSLASTLSMDYLDNLAEHPLAQRNEWHPIYDMLGEHAVGTFLKARGYTFAQVGGWWAPMQANAAADENHDFGYSEFGWLFLRRTILPPIVERLEPGTLVARQMRWDNGQCQRVPRQMQAIRDVVARPEPTFTFAHILVPHEPYTFDETGRCMELPEVASRGQREGYRGQILYANSIIESLVDDLLARPDKPVIILQADEGPYPETYRTSNRDWRIATPSELAMKTGILNAWYLPDGDTAMLDPGITPVNTFRVLFDKLFGTRLGRLPDRTFAFPDYGSIYEFFEVTETARSGDSAPAGAAAPEK